MRMRLRHRLVLFGDALVAAGDDLAHRGEVVDSLDGLDLEFAIGGFVHRAVFPHDHGGDRLRALDVRDVEALDAAGQFGQREDVLQALLDRFLAGLQDAEALIVALLRVLPGEVDERAFFSALRDGDLDLVAGAFAEQSGERGAVGEVDREINGARNVMLVDVELLEQRGEEGSGFERERVVQGVLCCRGPLARLQLNM